MATVTTKKYEKMCSQKTHKKKKEKRNQKLLLLHSIKTKNV